MSTASEEEDRNMMLNIRATIDGKLVVESNVADVASVLTETDGFITAAGTSRDETRLWAMNALETRCYAEGSSMLDRVIGTLLWLACRGHPGGGKIEEAALHGGVLECRFQRRDGQPGTLDNLQFALLAPTEEQSGNAPGSSSVN